MWVSQNELDSFAQFAQCVPLMSGAPSKGTAQGKRQVVMDHSEGFQVWPKKSLFN
jgi:hypothetical protein